MTLQLNGEDFQDSRENQGLGGLDSAKNGKGMVIWITGLSGAGKSAIAKKTHELLRSYTSNAVLMDGDQFRFLMGNDLGHSPEDRLENAYRLARFCNFLGQQGLHVVCATMSLFHECQAWNRQNIDRYFEVYIRVSLDVLIRRDPKGIYSRALRGEEHGVVGIDLPFCEPEAPNLIIESSEDCTDFTPMAERILSQAGFPIDKKVRTPSPWPVQDQNWQRK